MDLGRGYGAPCARTGDKPGNSAGGEEPWSQGEGIDEEAWTFKRDPRICTTDRPKSSARSPSHRNVRGKPVNWPAAMRRIPILILSLAPPRHPLPLPWEYRSGPNAVIQGGGRETSVDALAQVGQAS